MKKRDLPDRYTDLRIEKGISQTELAKEFDCNKQYISLIESGDRDLSITMLVRYADFFNVSTDYLLGRTDIKSTDTTIQSVCEYTGLSESNIKFLRILEEAKIISNADYFYNDVINLILSLLQSYGSLLTNVQELLSSDSYKWDSLSMTELENEFPNITQRIYGKGRFVTGYEHRQLLIATINRNFGVFIDCIEEMSKIDAQPHEKLNIWEKSTKRHLGRFKHRIINFKNMLSNGLKSEEFIMIDIDSDK